MLSAFANFMLGGRAKPAQEPASVSGSFEEEPPAILPDVAPELKGDPPAANTDNVDEEAELLLGELLHLHSKHIFELVKGFLDGLPAKFTSALQDARAQSDQSPLNLALKIYVHHREDLDKQEPLIKQAVLDRLPADWHEIYIKTGYPEGLAELISDHVENRLKIERGHLRQVLKDSYAIQKRADVFWRQRHPHLAELEPLLDFPTELVSPNC